MSAEASMFPELVLPALMGVLLGASAHRSGLCTVKAVAEVVTTGRAHVMFSFLKASFWTFGLLSAAVWLGAEPGLSARPASLMGLAGGLVFGLGAGLNGACSFSTLARLAEGHTVMLATLFGLATALFAMRGVAAGWHEPVWPTHLPRWTIWLGLVWILFEGAKIARLLFRRRMAAFEDGHWPLSIGVLVLALAITGLWLVGRPWSFTSTAICAAGVADIAPCGHPGALVEVTGVAFVAMLASAGLRGSFRLRRVRAMSALRHMFAGLLMGTGAAMMPGGNDGLILLGLPAMSPHALPDWLAIVAGIWVAMSVSKRFGRRIPVIRCDGDICRASL